MTASNSNYDSLTIDWRDEDLDPVISSNKIKYVDCMTRSNNFKPFEVSWNAINDHDFAHIPFFEALISPTFVHLYFDFDEIATDEELYDVLEWLDKVAKVFGKYSYGGYSNDESIAKEIGFRYIANDKHYVSMHVIYYETRISASDLQMIMSHTAKGGYKYDGVHKLCDPNVYKLVPRYNHSSTRQLFRHVLSDKIYSPGSPDNKNNHGKLVTGTPSQHIVQVHGNEPVITAAQWSTLFKLKDKPTMTKNPVFASTKPNNHQQQSVIPTRNIGDNFLVDSSLIMLNDEELYGLVSEFEPEYDNLITILPILYHSSYELQTLSAVLTRWYNQREHTNGCPVDNFVNYYEQELSNKWFFSLLKHVDKNVRNQYLSKFVQNKVDESVIFNIKGEFSLDTLRTKHYENSNGYGIRVGEFLTDLKQVLVFINSGKPLFIIKEHANMEDNAYKLSYLDYKGLSTLLNSIYLGKYVKEGKEHDVTALTIFNSGRNKNIFMKSAISFYSDNPSIFSYFQGYDYTITNDFKPDIIQPILTHIHDIIAANNDEVYKYIVSWVSYIIKNPKAKTEVALVINGDQGTGKNMPFTDIICKLLGIYATPNLNNLDYLTGKFNAMLENKKLIVCNEISSADTNKYFNADSLKSILTEKRMLINQKCEPVREVENVVNLIIVSNHVAPVKIERGDRRYMVTTTSNKYAGDYEYFNKLAQVINHPEFYQQLFTFFMNCDISNWNSRNIPMTESKENIQQSSLSPFELFIQYHKKDFVEGYIKDDSYDDFMKWSQDIIHLSNIPNKITFNKHMNSYCKAKQLRRKGSRPYCYVLREEYLTKFKNDNTNDDDDFDFNAPDEIAGKLI